MKEWPLLRRQFQEAYERATRSLEDLRAQLEGMEQQLGMIRRNLQESAGRIEPLPVVHRNFDPEAG
jgi:hypothetical protein